MGISGNNSKYLESNLIFKMFFFFRGKRLKTERKIHTVSKYLLDSIFWAKVLGQWSSHQLPSNVRWGSKMSFPLLFRRSRNIFVQFHGESGPWYDSEIKKPVSVWSCLCNLVRDCNNLSLFARQCKSWWGTILTKMVPEQLDGKNLSEIDRTQDNQNQLLKEFSMGSNTTFWGNILALMHPQIFTRNFIWCILFTNYCAYLMRSIYLAFENLRENCIEVFEIVLKSL